MNKVSIISIFIVNYTLTSLELSMHLNHKKTLTYKNPMKIFSHHYYIMIRASMFDVSARVLGEIVLWRF